jgi:type II secretory pathway predicted ATPase ExeA
MALLEDVFRLSGLPTYTFVEPVRYQEIKISIRTSGRCSVIEGPSGIGKTTTVFKALEELGLRNQVMSLSARRPQDAELIAELPGMKDIGTVIVDDFHRLPDTTKAGLSDFMKLLAEADSDNPKLILIGINKAGQQLVNYAHDLGMRIDVFKLGANPVDKIEQLIT